MIKPVEYRGYLWKVTFQYTPNREACKAQGGPNVTHCMVTPCLGIGMWDVVPPSNRLVGVGQRAHGDKPSYEIGRKVALKRALATAPREFRAAIWAAYLGRKKAKPTQQEGWERGMVRLRDQIRLWRGLVMDCQEILGRYLPPDGISADQAVSELLGLLDGPQWRDAEKGFKQNG
jgi:hypothetical protein